MTHGLSLIRQLSEHIPYEYVGIRELLITIARDDTVVYQGSLGLGLGQSEKVIVLRYGERVAHGLGCGARRPDTEVEDNFLLVDDIELS